MGERTSKVNVGLEPSLVAWVDSKKSQNGLSRGRSGFIRDLVFDAWRKDYAHNVAVTEAEEVGVKFDMERDQAVKMLVENRRQLASYANRLDEWAIFVRRMAGAKLPGEQRPANE